MAENIDVLILVQEGCHFCRDAQRLLVRLADEYPLQVRTLEIRTREGEGVALEAGLLFPPGILLRGRPLCYGRPSEGKLRRAIEQLLAERPHELRLRGAIEGMLDGAPDSVQASVAGGAT